MGSLHVGVGNKTESLNSGLSAGERSCYRRKGERVVPEDNLGPLKLETCEIMYNRFHTRVTGKNCLLGNFQ